MTAEFKQCQWDELVASQARLIARWAVEEDLGGLADWTTNSLVADSSRSGARMVSRQDGTIAGLPAIDVLLAEWGLNVVLAAELADGEPISAGGCLGRLSGPTREILTYERPLLNLVSRLAGIATATAAMVAQVESTGAAVYDTRKTTPGYRHLEKYAVHCGGGHNHRCGLYDAVLIKDNHLAASELSGVPEQAIRRARAYLRDQPAASAVGVLEIEVDSLEQLRRVLPEGPDIVLLDNFALADLRAAVEARDAATPRCVLEASGSVRRDTIRSIAETGVDRISCGSLTHSSNWLDIGLDWDAR